MPLPSRTVPPGRSRARPWMGASAAARHAGRASASSAGPLPQGRVYSRRCHPELDPDRAVDARREGLDRVHGWVACAPPARPRCRPSGVCSASRPWSDSSAVRPQGAWARTPARRRWSRSCRAWAWRPATRKRRRRPRGRARCASWAGSAPWWLTWPRPTTTRSTTAAPTGTSWRGPRSATGERGGRFCRQSAGTWQIQVPGIDEHVASELLSAARVSQCGLLHHGFGGVDGGGGAARGGGGQDVRDEHLGALPVRGAALQGKFLPCAPLCHALPGRAHCVRLHGWSTCSPSPCLAGDFLPSWLSIVPSLSGGHHQAAAVRGHSLWE